MAQDRIRYMPFIELTASSTYGENCTNRRRSSVWFIKSITYRYCSSVLWLPNNRKVFWRVCGWYYTILLHKNWCSSFHTHVRAYLGQMPATNQKVLSWFNWLLIFSTNKRQPEILMTSQLTVSRSETEGMRINDSSKIRKHELLGLLTGSSRILNGFHFGHV